MAGIYLHIPFCRQACNYCDFHFSTVLSGKPQLVQALVKELALRSAYLPQRRIGSIYFGGGTPSLLDEAELNAIMEALDRHFEWDQGAEITFEANPDDISAAALESWRRAGINRLSIGLQSFNEEELRWMNRAHTAQESLSSVMLAQDKGFHNLSIDLIYGSRFQTEKGWESTLRQAVALQTPHISSYNLTIEGKTLLGSQHARGAEPAVSEPLSSAQFGIMTEVLGEAGFEQYEISNFAKPGFRARHNSNYWLQQPYLGLGPSAHSFNGVSRQWNVSNNARYTRAVLEGHDFFEKEELSLRDRYNEYVLTRLRTLWGCDLEEMRRLFGEDAAAHFLKKVGERAAQFEVKEGVYTLKASARLLADGIASALFL